MSVIEWTFFIGGWGWAEVYFGWIGVGGGLFWVSGGGWTFFMGKRGWEKVYFGWVELVGDEWG